MYLYLPNIMSCRMLESIRRSENNNFIVTQRRRLNIICNYMGTSYYNFCPVSVEGAGEVRALFTNLIVNIFTSYVYY